MKKRYNLLFNLLFYFMLVVLLCALIYPHTSLSYRKPIFQPYGARLNKTDVKLKVGEGFRLHVVGVNVRATYQSRDFKVASVDINGNVRAWRKGTTVITVKSNGRALKCRVRVIE